MAGVIDLEGQRFGRLVASHRVGVTAASKSIWQCTCDCGRITSATTGNLRSGNTSSCGCLSVETTVRRSTKHGAKKRGERPSDAYVCWVNMRSRCNNPKHPQYKDYGERGIKVCARWQTFENFFDDMGDPPEGLTLDRIDNNGGYEPHNCRWATRAEQRRNQRPPTEKAIEL